jgi:nucleoside-diphosphate-sugar epimerase
VRNERPVVLPQNRPQTDIRADSMHYFVTGATGFIGKRLVGKLLERKDAVVYFLVRQESASKVADLHAFCPEDMLTFVNYRPGSIAARRWRR